MLPAGLTVRDTTTTSTGIGSSVASSTAPTPPRPPPGAPLAVGATLASLLLLLWPVLGSPGRRLLGSMDSEAPAHLHWLAACLAGLPEHGPFVLVAHPLGLEPSDALMDPVSVLLVAPVSALAGGGTHGFSLGWNLLPALGLLLSALGAWTWARAWLKEDDPGAWGAGLAASLAACSVWTLCQVEIGRSECFLYPAYVLHGGLLFAAVRDGGRQRWVLACLALLPLIGCGVSSLPLFLTVQLAALLWALAGTGRERWRPTILGLSIVTVTAAVATVPLLTALRANPPPNLVDLGGRVPGPSPDLLDMAGLTTDLTHGLPGYELVPWVGLAVVGGAVLAAWRWKPARLPLLLLVGLWVLTAGPQPNLRGHLLWGPTALLEALPGKLGLVRGWGRMVGILIPVLAVIAAAGVRRRPAWAAVLVLLGMGEAAARRGLPGSFMSLEPPPEVALLEEQGARFLEIPTDRLALTRRLVEGPPAIDPWGSELDPGLFIYLDQHVGNLPHLFDRQSLPPVSERERGDLRRRASKLRKHGVHGVLLRSTDLVPGTIDRAHQALDPVLCQPSPKNPWYWSVPEDPEAPCARDGGLSTTAHRPLGESATGESR